MPTVLIHRKPAAGRWASRAAVVVAMAVAVLGGSGRAAAQANKDDLASTVAKLNKKALDEYENLNFEEARKILKDALDFCHEAGLDNHPVTARTNIHLGVVVLTGFKQRDAAVKYFRKALEIQPDIKMTKSLANPEIQAAFDEVAASMSTKGVTPPPLRSGSESGISHEPVTRGQQGQSIPISVTIDPALTPDKVMIWYRVGNSGDFTSRDMTEATPGNYAAEIPGTATTGSQVTYFIEAQKAGQPIATLGAQANPFPVALQTPAPPMGLQQRPKAPSARPADSAPSFYLGLAVGTGVGWATGAGEINAKHIADPAGLAPAQLLHLGPEVGYFLSPDLLLSVQARIQFLSGVTAQTQNCATPCGSPPSTAVAAFARLTWFLSTDTVKPFLSASVGGGRIRHVAEFPQFPDCGAGTTTCVESIPAGTVLLGPGAGIVYSVTPAFGLVGGVNTQLGFPRFTLNVDLNAGFAALF
jgi:Tfp pilus assembly protein PilF